MADVPPLKLIQGGLDAVEGPSDEAPGLDDEDGGGSEMNERITRLETHFEYIRRDLDDIRTHIGNLTASVADLPTRRDLWLWKWQWTALVVAAIALIVGGIIGGLSWIRPEPSLPVPVVIQVPADALPSGR